MEYSKPPFTFEDQAGLLLQRGLEADHGDLIKCLNVVNYYRLSGYLYPFRISESDEHFRPGTSLNTVWRRYAFDRRLRPLVLDAIERIEVAVRTQLVYWHVHQHGPFGYTVPAFLPNLKKRRDNDDRFGKLLSDIRFEFQRSKEEFAGHFRRKYGDRHAWPPLWIAAEVMTFGNTLTLFRGVSDNIKKKVSGHFDQTDEVLESWLLSLNGVRNLCAHHSRLWNRTLGLSPKIPKPNKHPQWHSPASFPNDRLFAILTILKYMLGFIAPQSRWPQRLRDLLAAYPELPRESMGFPQDWESCPIWQTP